MSHKSKSPAPVASKASNVVKKDNSQYIHQEPKINFKLSIREKHQHTDKQKVILEKMLDKDTKIICIDGIWGSSKTYLSVLAALKLLNDGHTRKIYYIRSPCESSDTAKIGILPGTLQERLAGYDAVLFEKLEEFLPGGQVNKLIADGYIEFIPPGFLRGRNFTNSTLICDESSNFSLQDIYLISSRMGERTRAFLVGDSFQNDIGNRSGFKRFFNMINDEESREQGCFCYEMRNKEDILRSGFIRFLMEKTGVIKGIDNVSSKGEWQPKGK